MDSKAERKRKHADETPEERAERKRLKRERKLAKAQAQQSEATAAAEPEPEADSERVSKRRRVDGEANGDERVAKQQKTAKQSNGAAKPSETVAAFRERLRVEVLNADSTPIMTFQHDSVPSFLLPMFATYSQPTAIQAECWPLAMAGRDLIGIAATGSGKTIAFGVPLLKSLQSRGKAKSGEPFGLVLAPTRELAMQINVVFEEFSKVAPLPFRSICIYGGMPKSDQRTLIKRGAEVIVATPGRLLDFIEEGAIDLKNVCFAVLDEADRMLDMGFEKDIRRILGSTGARQTLMFSATWPPEVKAIAQVAPLESPKLQHTYLKDPARVNVGSLELAANHDVAQEVEVLEPHQKDARLLSLLREHRKDKAIVFCLYKKEAARVEEMLVGRGFEAQAIHGDLGQRQRQKVLDEFRDGGLRIMVATDVAARGLDVHDIDFVINYTFPLTIEDYVHRIGRTARAGRKGRAHTFFTKFDKPHAGELGNILREANLPVPEALMKFGQFTKRKKTADGPDPDLIGKTATHTKFDDDD